MNVIFLVFCFLGYLCVVKARGSKNSKDKLLRGLFNKGFGSRHIVNHPGYALIKPVPIMLKSSVKFPHDDKHLVYGNSDNVGIPYDNSAVLYSGFRKGNILEAILKAVKKYENKNNMKNPPVIIIQKEKLPKLKGHKLIDTNLRMPNFLENNEDHIRQSAIGSKDTKISKKKTNKARSLFDTLRRSKFYTKTRKETLDQKTKRIQDLLNSGVNAKSAKADSSTEIATKVKEFLNNIPLASEKLSLDAKTKYIEDFLNNKMTVFTDGNSLNYVNKNKKIVTAHNSIIEEENNANEIMDQYSSENSNNGDEIPDYRRKSKKKKRKYRERDSLYESKESMDSDESASSDYERNPGNPFTIHKNKYKQNWLWNHFMDGDHMNINPFGPPFANMGPSGADLFFGRKWWYYNQDDYKPMG